MIAALLLMLVPVAAAPPAVEQQIVVLAEKLKRSRFTWKASDDSGEWKLKYCRIKRSSGDAEVDAISCRALDACLPVMPLGYKGKTAPPEFWPCVTEHRAAMIADLATRRSAALDAAP